MGSSELILCFVFPIKLSLSHKLSSFYPSNSLPSPDGGGVKEKLHRTWLLAGAKPQQCQRKNQQDNTPDFTSLTICDLTNHTVVRNKIQHNNSLKSEEKVIIVWDENNYKYL